MTTPSHDLPERPPAPLPVGISQCLLGAQVRYDGTGAPSSFPARALDGLFEYHTICPEVGIGMSVPRDPIRLVGSAADYRVVGVRDPAIDKTDELQRYALDKLPALEQLAGYIFMHNSPSCGLHRVKVYGSASGPPVRNGRGAYAAEITRHLPQLPVEDAGRLFDEVLRENFVSQTFAYAHWQRVVADLTAARLIEFHSRYKYLLMAHSQVAYREAGRLLSDLSGDLPASAAAYIGVLMQGLRQPANRAGHANVLAHLQGYLKRHIDSASRRELAALIDEYRRGEQPLLAPMALLRHHFGRHPDPYVLAQTYLEPHPNRAGLRRTL